MAPWNEKRPGIEAGAFPWKIGTDGSEGIRSER